MDKRTADALEASSKHWEENVAAETPEGAKIFAENCALCALFNSNTQDEDACLGCPVMDVTGRSECGGSPWSNAFRAHTVWTRDPHSSIAQSDFRAFAQAELDFLISLREPVTR